MTVMKNFSGEGRAARGSAMNILKTHRRIEVVNSNIIPHKTLGKSIRINKHIFPIMDARDVLSQGNRIKILLLPQKGIETNPTDRDQEKKEERIW